jgi:hypothetical protein
MRLIWSNENNWFQAEYQRDDVDFLKTAKFRTLGPPQWIWYAPPPGIVALDRLRKNPPPSGLIITELALERYNSAKEQFNKKTEVKKLYEHAKQVAEEAAAPKWETYQDPDTGITCFIVKPIEEVFHWKFTPPIPPAEYCFVCGSPVYLLDYPDLCLWCSKTF